MNTIVHYPGHRTFIATPSIEPAENSNHCHDRDLVYGVSDNTIYNLAFTSRETVHLISPLGSDCGA